MFESIWTKVYVSCGLSVQKHLLDYLVWLCNFPYELIIQLHLSTVEEVALVLVGAVLSDSDWLGIFQPLKLLWELHQWLRTLSLSMLEGWRLCQMLVLVWKKSPNIYFTQSSAIVLCNLPSLLKTKEGKRTPKRMDTKLSSIRSSIWRSRHSWGTFWLWTKLFIRVCPTLAQHDHQALLSSPSFPHRIPYR